MKLQTEIPLQPQTFNQIDYHSKICLFGSCFAEHIGQKLDYFKFQNELNPFGILFHPLAIENLITAAINKKVYSESDIFFHNEQWHSFETHSRLSSTSKDELLNSLNKYVKSTSQQIHDATHIIFTLGTSWVYRYIETDIVVANCHKIPQKKFVKELLTVDEVSESLQGTVSLIRSINPKATLVFTVSPVRHLKDGFIENTQSKSHLIAAIHQLVEPRQNTHYFPSYEIMMDQLRDYRFYSEDMIHPNQTAVDFIWGQFKKVWIANEASVTMDQIDGIQKGMQHRPFHPNSEAHQEFLQNLEQKKKDLMRQFPHLKF
ncbi:GSCFA domain-containing protein [Geojedonia litorea]|uniref:GSCFA domain-containing protein n=1 Tax=Geojedonia litorea TaxID=1268269 RepID=A0ABV9MZG8_9FLAO